MKYNFGERDKAQKAKIRKRKKEVKGQKTYGRGQLIL